MRTSNPLWWILHRGRLLLAAAVRVNRLRPLESDVGGGGGGGLEAWFRALSGLWLGSDEASVGITVENKRRRKNWILSGIFTSKGLL